jgi:hypothetical protein
MHAVVVTVTLKDREAAESILRERVVPGVSQAPGFVTGYWTGRDGRGISMVIFDSEEDAQRASETVRENAPGDAVTVDSVEVWEVVAHA